MFSKGDKVAVLDDAINGVVLAVKGNEVTIETEEGFVMNFSANVLFKIIFGFILIYYIKLIIIF